MRKEGATAEARLPSGARRTGAKRCHRPLWLREKLYKRVLELRNEGLSYSEIIRKIEEEFGERLSKSHVSLWVRGLRKPTGKVKYELEVGPDLAWLLGALVGDGKKAFKHGKKGYYIIEVEAKPELVKIFAQTIPKVVGREPLPIYPAQRGNVRAGFECVKLYYLLSDFSKLREVVESSLEMVAVFLQGVL